MSERKPIEPVAWGADLRVVSEDPPSSGDPGRRLLFVAGCTGSSAGSPQDQIRGAYGEVGEVLGAAGASWDDVVEMTTYLVEFRRDIDLMTEIHREFVIEEPFPAWTAVGVTQLYSPNAIVEIFRHRAHPADSHGGNMTSVRESLPCADREHLR